MPDRNARERERARKLGQDTYRHEVLDTWPACTECGATIRHRSAAHWRSCGCEGVRWDCYMGGWERRDVDA